MAGTEREFLEMLPPRERDHRYMEADNSIMRDFWRSTSDQESIQELRHSGGRGDHNLMPPLPEHSLRPYGDYSGVTLQHPHGAVVGPESVVTMEVNATRDGNFFPAEYDHHAHPYPQLDLPDSHSASSATLPTYTNFFHSSYVADNTNSICNSVDCHHELPELKHNARYVDNTPENPYGHSGEDQQYNDRKYPERYSDQYQDLALVPPVGIPVSHNVTFLTTTASDRIHRNAEMETLRRELEYKCPRSADLLVAITRSADAAVREFGSATSGVSSDDDQAPDEQNPGLAQHDPDLRAAITDHPYFPELVVSHIRIFKIGAPRELRNKLDDMTRKFQRFQDGSTMRIGDDPSLDFFMRSYVDLLVKVGEDIEEPFHKFMQFKDATTKALENICGHYIEKLRPSYPHTVTYNTVKSSNLLDQAAGPDESDNYGFDIGPVDGAQDSDELDMLGDEGLMYSYGDVDESIVVDPSAPEEELRRMLMMKYGRHIGGLKAEFNRVRKKGKLPSNARCILKDWFNRHSYWPYPSDAEKQYLQRICSLNLKQINNWFINERKRHWSCEGKCMHPNVKFYSNSNGEGPSHLEHME